MDSFLRMNGCKLNVTSEEIVLTALMIADHHNSGYSREDLTNWIIKHQSAK
jgi:prophage maintenance system killer protein